METNEKNNASLKIMYEVFSSYDVDDCNDKNKINDRFLEMMSDYKNYNKLMNAAFSINTSVFTPINEDIEDKRIVYNIKKFGQLYKVIYESYLRCFINESDDWNPSFKTHKDTYNSFIKWYDSKLKHMNKEELLDMLKTIIQDIEEDQLNVLK